jgi:hypothetical protein
MADFPRGAKVDADFGDGYQIAFVLDGPDGPEDKYVIQSPDNGKAVGGFAYREAADVAASGGDSGLTFKKL